LIWVTLFSNCSLKHDTIISENTQPIIESVQLIKILNKKTITTSSLQIGEKSNFIIVAKDLNKNIEKLYIKSFLTESPNIQPYFESGPIEVKPHTHKIDSYTLPEPIKVKGPPGKWRFDIQVSDKENYMSNVYTIYAIVH
jgi:hypothetical protein